MLFRQLFDPQSSTYSYLLADPNSREAILIDPVFEQVRRDAALVSELGLTLTYTVETHVHADHVTGAAELRRRMGSKVAISKASGAEGADRYLVDGDRVGFGERYVSVRATPGHTDGCLTFVLDNESMAFTGDCLLIRGCGRTDFQGGNAGLMYQSVHTKIFTLPERCLLYPGHDYRGLTATSVGEEKSHNPRLGGQLSQSDFTGFMDNLGLPHPKKIDVAVPSNLKVGEVSPSNLPLDEPDWAPMTYTFAGFWEVQPHWLEENLGNVQVLDVREPDEFTGPLGRIPGAIPIPLGELKDRTADLSTETPIVAVCRAGGRSAQAIAILKKNGFEDVANLAGGMLLWRAQHCTVDGGLD